MSRTPSRRLLPYGDRAILVECADLAEMRALHTWLTAQGSADSAGSELSQAIEEVIPGARTLLLRLNRPWLATFDRTIIDAEPAEPELISSATVRIPVVYDGQDLPEVASILDCSPAEVIRRHTERRWAVAFCGFAPGFAYLAPADAESRTGPPPLLTVPRRSSPRTSVPAGSVGLADQWSGIYPRAAPGGWQLIGRTTRPVWDLQQDPPALLQPGMQVSFEQVSPDDDSDEGDRSGRAGDAA